MKFIKSVLLILMIFPFFISGCAEEQEEEEKNKGYYLTETMLYDDIEVTIDSISETPFYIESTNTRGYTIRVNFTIKNTKSKDFNIDNDCFIIKTEDKNEKYETEQWLFSRTIMAGGSSSYWLDYNVPYSISEKNYIMCLDWGILSFEEYYYLYYRNSNSTSSSVYKITIGTIENGSISLTKENARAGETLTPSITANAGYQLKDNSYYINGVAHTGSSFVMPEEDIEISAIFELTAEAQNFRSTFPLSIDAQYYSSQKHLYVDIKNNSDSAVTGVKFLFIAYDAYGNKIKKYGTGSEYANCNVTTTINANKSYKAGWTISGFSGISRIDVIAYSVKLYGAGEWGSSTADTSVIQEFGRKAFVKII